MRRAVLLVVVLLVVAWSLHAGAEEHAGDGARFALESRSSADARTCADAEVLRAKVAERLGRDPFTDEASARIRVAFARDKARAWTAEIGLFDASGNRVGGRALTHAGATCDPLTTSVVLTIAVLLEDLAPAPPPPAPRPAPEPTPEPPPAAGHDVVAPAPHAPEAAPRTTRVDVALGAAGVLGGAPAPSGGPELALGIDVAHLRVEISGRMILPVSSEGDVAVRTRLVHGRLAPCYGWPVLAGCIVAAVGSVSGEAVGEGVASSRLAGQLYAAGGLGALSRFFVVDDLLFVRASIDLLFAATRAGFDVGDRRVWTVPVVSAAGGLALGVRLP